ncbi:putative uncharacterized protein DDB_G0284213 [Patella vulgata]|uniref:putative uncharacterized protein DDB_G0284213 n=1 Tax=Patella vulgata TaxID=6465 RepID=UPI0021803AD0|nr:putative uncharacterized protein DDB_G0284213 [Patella vulgata]
MSCDVDELDVNPFFRALQTTYLDLYEKAQEKCHVICVPQKSSLVGVAINQKLIETHILKPSPYFKGQFLTIHSAGNKTVVLDENGQIIKTLQGFSGEKKVKVLSEELAYNKTYEHYKILIIESPLDSKVVSNLNTKETALNDLLKPKSTFIESKFFLQSFKEYTKTILQLDKSLTEFNEHYMVLSDYLSDAGDRIQAMITETVEKCLKCSKHKIQSDGRFKDVLRGAVESYILGMVHYKIFGVICDKKKKEDKDLLVKCHQLDGITPVQLRVNKQFSCPLPSAVVELARLDSLCTPCEKLTCLKSTIDNIADEIEAVLSKNKQKEISLEKQEMPCLTSDDLIPILVTVIAQAKCTHLESDIYYMENFNWHSTIKDMDSFSYCLVTFKAAVQFMQTTNFDYLQHQSKVKKEISINELMAKVKISSPSTSTTATTTSLSDENNKSLRIDRQLDKISNFLQVNEAKNTTFTSSEEKKFKSIFNEPPKRYSPHSTMMNGGESSDQNPLGDFLSSLQDDMFDQPFGKQT